MINMMIGSMTAGIGGTTARMSGIMTADTNARNHPGTPATISNRSIPRAMIAWSVFADGCLAYRVTIGASIAIMRVRDT